MSEKDFKSNISIDNDNKSSTSFTFDDTNTSQNTPSTKSNKLSRIRSFKEDILEKFSQMRTPTNVNNNNHRPNSPKHHKKVAHNLLSDDSKTSSHDFSYHARQVKHVLVHFKDVINKNKPEMLAGNCTVLLESIANINSSLKNNKHNVQSSAVISATQKIQLILGKIIKICDDALVSDNEEHFIAINKENLKELIEQLQDGINNLIDIANEAKSFEIINNSQQQSSKFEDMAGQRNSLPDITTTPKEENQQLYSSNLAIRTSHSIENILNDSSPPPKPIRSSLDNHPPPPIPPKKFLNKECDFLPFANVGDKYLRPMESKSPDKVSSNGSMGSISNNNLMDMESFNQPNFERISNLSEQQFLSKASFERSSNESGSLSITTQCNTIKHHRSHQIIINSSSSDVSNEINDEQFLQQGETNFLRRNTWNEAKVNSSDESKPPLPIKTKPKSLRSEHHHRSLYDNVDSAECHSPIAITTTSSSNSSLSSSTITSISNSLNIDIREHFESREHSASSLLNYKHMSCIEPRNLIFDKMDETSENENEKPPLPPKQKKHIMAYMEIFGNASHNSQFSNHNSTLTRHSMHTFSQSSKIFNQEKNLFIGDSNLLNILTTNEKPALPPKMNRRNLSSPPQSPQLVESITMNEFNPQSSIINSSDLPEEKQNEDNEIEEPFNESKNPKKETEVVLRRKSLEKPSLNLIEEIEISEHLIFKRDDEDGPDIKGGHVDALIVHATKIQKISEAFGEAFLATFRTFIQPMDLVDKLTHRYSYFNCHINDQKQKAAKESFSLLVRVVNDLTVPDLTVTLMQKLIEFVHDLVSSGELSMAKLLRTKVIEKTTLIKLRKLNVPINLSFLPIISNPPMLLELKSTDIAEQMTILDAELFQKIEIPEVLLWSQQQCEEKSPNLTLFTAHFNKLSFWARTQILKQQDAKDREKYVMKFIKIMKHLRKINNFNSYLAILSALDSAPIRRLEWQKNITEGLKEYCALIDSSSSFRAYRQALSETVSPCIPYIGLVLQDLTFVHIGNPDCLPDGSINFSKRWQQYNIVMNMKRFRNNSYVFKRNDRIIGFFDNFEDYFDEDAMWHISEKIKPKNHRKV